jgi:hypothetical protein
MKRSLIESFKLKKNQKETNCIRFFFQLTFN